jgi:hypothetical protein
MSVVAVIAAGFPVLQYRYSVIELSGLEGAIRRMGDECNPEG